MCGGTRGSSPRVDARQGLSPRVRGNLNVDLRAGAYRGSIPACAGEPRQPLARFSDPGVYPRVCGGTIAGRGRPGNVVGLSPRVRGNPPASHLEGENHRSIPACAGEPISTCSKARSGQVYPRVCGGTCSTLNSVSRFRGLSPRVRGNLSRLPDRDQKQGSIPACAGEPGGPAAVERKHEVYPRVCGGTPKKVRMSSESGGLSPRVRGNRNCYKSCSGR